MAAPLKPWERSGFNSQNTGGLPPCCAPGGVKAGIGQLNGPTGVMSTSGPPPLPPRPSDQSRYGNTGVGAGGYGSYGGMGYGSSYGGGGMGMGMYSSPYSSMQYGSGAGAGAGMYGGNGYGSRYSGMAPGGPTSFVQQAEDSTRPAFQSIESIVQAFGSISMMLDSTYYAVFNSFRAVLGVADHFTRLKNHFSQVFSTFALVRTLKWVYHKLLVFFGLRQGDVGEDLWHQASNSTSQEVLEGDLKRKSNWPIIMFFAVTLGGPWLIWKLISSFTDKPGSSEWHNGNDDHFVGRTLYNFNGESQQELNFTQGQLVYIAPKELQPRMKGWLLGCVDGEKTGIVPANYIKILGKQRGKRHGANLPTTVPVDQQHTNSGNVTSDLETHFNPLSTTEDNGELVDMSAMNEYFNNRTVDSAISSLSGDDPGLSSIPSDTVPPVCSDSEKLDACSCTKKLDHLYSHPDRQDNPSKSKTS